MLFFIMQLFISVLMGKGYIFKGQSLKNGLSCMFEAVNHILLQWGRENRTKHRQKCTKVKAKEIDSVWSQVCSLL